MNFKLIILICIITLAIFFIFNMSNGCEPFNYNKDTPKIIHLIYIPWDKNQKIKENYMDFDIKPYEKIKNENPDFEVKMWILPEIQNFLNEFYPEYYNDIFNVERPAMTIDLLRLLFVYHYGGIYWQYGSINKTNMINFLPPKNKKVKLFTEKILSVEESNKMKLEPIRNNEPEELIRVCTQIFSSVPKNDYIFTLFSTGISNVKKYLVKKDYDILYITGNAMMSTVYDKIGKNQSDIELVDYNTNNKMIKISSNGSWRTDK